MYAINLNSGELKHYGVKGMKWGVRNDTRILINNRRNAAVKKAKMDYKQGKITKAQRKEAIRKANARKKKQQMDIENEFSNAKTDKGRLKIERKYRNLADRNVSDLNTKRGLTYVKQVLSGLATADAVATGVLGAATMAVSPGMGAMLIGNAALAAAANVGMSAVVQRGILDKAY